MRLNPNFEKIPMGLFRVAIVVFGIIAAIQSASAQTTATYKARNCRAHSASLKEFGGVGDGVTSNTEAFKKAITHLAQFASKGGAQLYVPPGKWLTGSFNLTSNFTLFLEEGAVLLATKDIKEWPLVAPLPSYGRGRDAPGGRYISLITGSNLTDVVITGNNGTLNGQGKDWWVNYRAKKLTHTRPYLIEIQHSNDILISNVTLIDSPSWNIHPIYSNNVIVKGVTILASTTSANTDGINPDSCTNVLIEDCYIVSGDDCVAVKSGWDQYGIAYNKPTKHVLVRRLTCISPTSAAIAVGSEMSGGVEDVRAEDITAINTEVAVRIKTAIGRGAYIKNIFARRFNMYTMKYTFRMGANYGSYADDGWDRKAIPVVEGISLSDMVSTNTSMAGKMEGLKEAPFKGICMSNVKVELTAKPKAIQWNCTGVEGVSEGVTPPTCPALVGKGLGAAKACPFPTTKLPIEDVVLKECSIPTVAKDSPIKKEL